METAVHIGKPRRLLFFVTRLRVRPVIMIIVQVELDFGQGGIIANKIEQLQGTAVAAIAYRPDQVE